MRLVEVKLTNFRSYAQETCIALDKLTILIGQNDAGKSSVLDALNIFFDEGTLEQNDLCVHANQDTVRIACVFEDLPSELVLDEQTSNFLVIGVSGQSGWKDRDR